mmetsp:Transcript_32885/g.115481  ORF Transcript_32885/g.115481 Transcript_32885/m.115481 type:complete len:211 (+) Transcript_32885:77-709(+)
MAPPGASTRRASPGASLWPSCFGAGLASPLCAGARVRPARWSAAAACAEPLLPPAARRAAAAGRFASWTSSSSSERRLVPPERRVSASCERAPGRVRLRQFARTRRVVCGTRRWPRSRKRPWRSTPPSSTALGVPASEAVVHRFGLGDGLVIPRPTGARVPILQSPYEFTRQACSAVVARDSQHLDEHFRWLHTKAVAEKRRHRHRRPPK